MRGDIVIVDFRPLNPAAKVRPAIIVQSDRYNAKLTNTIIAQITSNVSRSHEDTQLLIDQTHPDWPQSGLRLPSVINAANLRLFCTRKLRTSLVAFLRQRWTKLMIA